MIINVYDLSSHFERVADLLGEAELQRLLQDEISPQFILAWERRFQTETNADGSPWSSDLVDTGELRDSVEVIVENTSIIAGPGGDRNVKVAEEQADRGNVVGGIDEELDDFIMESLDNWMGRAFEERL